MTTDRFDHDRLIDDLLGDLASGEEREAVDRVSGMDAEEREGLGRVDLEILGLLPYALDPVEAGERLKARVLGSIHAERRPADVAGFPEAGAPSPTHRRRWALPLAATLALASLATAGFFAARLADQRRANASLTEELELARERNQALVASREQVAEARDQLALVTQPGVEMCPLQPREGATGEPSGVLYVAPDHQHWYLSLHGLPPEPEGHSYQLWFMVDGNPVSAGTFTVDGERVGLGSETMPEGTAGVMVTLEAGSGAERPSGPPVLYGDQVMRLL